MNLDHAEAKLPLTDKSVWSSDLQIIPLPTLTDFKVYYSMQLNCYQFRVHNGNTDFCCLWTEAEGAQGSSEIASCIIKLVNSGRILFMM